MRKISGLLVTALGVAGAATAAQAQDEFTLQLKWVTQAQFAGYYYALEHGYYEEEGLDVTIVPGGPDVNPIQVLIGGGADATVEWLGNPLATREAGITRTEDITYGTYGPTLFDAGKSTPWKFGNQPWLIETGSHHRENGGPHMLMPDGSIIEGAAFQPGAPKTK